MDDDDALFAQLNSLETSMREFDPTNLNTLLVGMGGDADDDIAMVTEPPFEVGRETILVRRPEDLCLGLVRDTRVCLKEKATCSFKSHEANKFVPPDTDVFILLKTSEDKKGNFTCASSPILDADKLENELIAHIQSLESKDTDFGALFSLISNNDITTLDELRNAKNLVRTVRKRVKDVRTPAKMSKQFHLEDTLTKLSAVQENLDDAMSSQLTQDMVVKILELSNDDSAMKELVCDILNSHAKNIETLCKRVRNALRSVQTHVTFRSREISDIHNVTEGLQVIVDEVKGTIGKRTATDAGLPDHSLWQQAATVNSRLDKSEKAMGRLVQQVAKIMQQMLAQTTRGSDTGPNQDPVLDQINPPGTSSSQQTARASGSYSHGNLGFDGIHVSGSRPSFNPGGPSIQNGFLFSQRVGGGGNGGSGGNNNGPNGGGNGGFSGNTNAPGGGAGNFGFSGNNNGGNIGGNIGGNNGGNGGNGGGSFSFGGGGGWNGGSSGLPFSSGPNNSSDLDAIRASIQELSQRISKCEELKLGGSDVVVIGDHVFRSSFDVQALLEEELGVGSVVYFSCFTSPNHILDLMFKAKCPSIQTAKDIKALRDLNLRDQEMKAFQSATHDQPRPNLFAHPGRLQQHTYKSKASQAGDLRFQPLGTAEDYGVLTDTDGLHQALINTLSNVQSNLMSDINRSLRGRSVLLALATQMLNVSVQSVTSLLAFLGQTFTQLNKSFEGPVLAWDCVCKSLEDLWDQKFFPTKSEMSSADFSSVTSLASLVIWSNLRMVSVASNLSTVKLSAHPIVTSSYIRFLIDHLAHKKDVAVADVLQQVKKLRTELEESKKEIATLKGKVATFESKTDRLSNKVDQLGKKK